jgi:uncharacterized OsmC-like protein
MIATKSALKKSSIERSQDRRVTTTTGRKPYRTEIAAKGHSLVVDEPLQSGGANEGPSPYDLLCAALGSCTTITLRMYADRKEWPLEQVIAHVEHRRIVPSGSTAVGAQRDHFLVELEVTGPLDEQQRTRLMEIAERCPVHRTLLAGAKVEVRTR